MKKMKLKGFVLPTAYVIGVTLLFLGIMYVGSNVKDDYVGDYIFSTSLFTDNLIPVVNDVEEEKISVDDLKELINIIENNKNNV